MSGLGFVKELVNVIKNVFLCLEFNLGRWYNGVVRDSYRTCYNLKGQLNAERYIQQSWRHFFFDAR